LRYTTDKKVIKKLSIFYQFLLIKIMSSLGKRNSEIEQTPKTSRGQKSGRIMVESVTDEHQNLLAALAKKYPDEQLIQNLQSSFEKIGDVLQTLVGVESAEEKERKRSLVVIGLPESTSSDSIARADADSDSIVSMLRSLKIQSRPDKVYRMGRLNTDSNNKKGPRLVKVVMPTSHLQRQTLGALKTCRQMLRTVSGFERAIIRPSLSPEELIADRELREKLKKARAENPGVRVYIKKGELMVDGKTGVIQNNLNC
jgi:hypothetical protein